ncbi:hypothetical protein L226DRAFT_376137 [Lentinus tigrinus ALCF2SS1-7]|uniref:Uncharacterized protein n=1 Tax=Lentinus tigrinus ALCF2SS1-6 TaxID=1328759 RepID=A0A5C2SLP6_9APHY|nr:hypothetical protein L227DRAFT_650423 [Lentinus tigrinus ALCF2SS1-6]RPD76427.1 hypothetical protein L226DRAFT_376137 [Lentinus tigrinus ALCF2SS1-7]
MTTMPVPETNIPALFLPAHLRLGATNWKEYKQAIETICRIAGVEDNLTPERHGGRQDEDWAERDELCKAIITLNVRDFPRYGVSAGKETPAHDVWAQLVKIHSPKRWCGLFKLEWIRPLTRLEWMLLMVAVVFAVLLAVCATDLKLARVELGNVRAGLRHRAPLSERLLQDVYGIDARRLKYGDL